jgi:hypothetical protein
MIFQSEEDQNLKTELEMLVERLKVSTRHHTLIRTRTST